VLVGSVHIERYVYYVCTVRDLSPNLRSRVGWGSISVELQLLSFDEYLWRTYLDELNISTTRPRYTWS
jgi:hypothetical protein